MNDTGSTYELFGERIRSRYLPGGLPFVHVLKQGYAKRVGIFAVRYGSFDRRFRPPGAESEETVPDGIAHFLEHLVFEMQQGSALERFSRRGALANAGTSHIFTCYYFSAVDSFRENFVDLVNFVRTPYITEENVEKERSIIEQEIRMYEDMPDEAKYNLLFRALFARHPIRNRIAGTVESINKITPELLLRCFSAFYRPENMVLCVVGDDDPRAVEELAEQVVSEDAQWCGRSGCPETAAEAEPPASAAPEAVRTMPVGLPKAVLGFKEVGDGRTGGALLEREIPADMLVEILFGRASRAFAQLYEEGLVDESFFAFASTYPDIGYVALGGDTPRPRAFLRKLGEVTERAEELITEEDFQRVKKKFIGEFLRRFNSVEVIGTLCAAYALTGLTLADVWEGLTEVTVDAVRHRARQLFRGDNAAHALVLPPGWEGEEA